MANKIWCSIFPISKAFSVTVAVVVAPIIISPPPSYLASPSSSWGRWSPDSICQEFWVLYLTLNNTFCIKYISFPSLLLVLFLSFQISVMFRTQTCGLASTRGKDPAGCLFIDSRKSNHRSKDIALSRENLQRTGKTRVKARKRTISLEGQESRTRKDRNQGQERTRI